MQLCIVLSTFNLILLFYSFDLIKHLDDVIFIICNTLYT